MTANEYRDIRKGMGLKQSELAELLGVSKRTVIYRENGSNISKEAQIAIRAIACDFPNLNDKPLETNES